MEKLLCPSMMCADYGMLKEEVVMLDEAGTDIFHCDIMDGSFVPNMTMGLTDVKAIRKYTDKMVDCHLMVEDPSEKIQWFCDAGVDLIYIHPESERYVIRTLMQIEEAGVKAGIALNPDTSLETIHEMLHFIDYVMVMTVNPGFAGQRFLEFTKTKIRELVALKEKSGFKITVDGACGPDVIKELSELGCDGFILGTSALFGQERNYKESMLRLRTL